MYVVWLVLILFVLVGSNDNYPSWAIFNNSGNLEAFYSPAWGRHSMFCGRSPPHKHPVPSRNILCPENNLQNHTLYTPSRQQSEYCVNTWHVHHIFASNIDIFQCKGNLVSCEDIQHTIIFTVTFNW